MRIRGLRAWIQEHGLTKRDKIESIQHLRLGLDATAWLRSIDGIKDDLVGVLGAPRDDAFSAIGNEIQKLIDNKIKGLLVFQGITPPSLPRHDAMNMAADEAWQMWYRNDFDQARYKFSEVSSNVSTDRRRDYRVHLQNHVAHLKSENSPKVPAGYIPEMIQGPYLAEQQLAYMVEHDVVDAVFGQPSLLPFGVPRVILSVNFTESTFDFVDLCSLLQFANVTEEDFKTACILAGNDYSRTSVALQTEFPNCNDSQIFGQALKYAARQQTPLQYYGFSSHSPNKGVQGYNVCKVLFDTPIVLSVQGDVGVVPPAKIGASEEQREARISTVPHDFDSLVGHMLPPQLYHLALVGLLGEQVINSLASLEWREEYNCAVDSLECHELQCSLTDRRRRVLGLLASFCHDSMKNTECRFAKFTPLSESGETQAFTVPYSLQTAAGLPWRISWRALRAEQEWKSMKETDPLTLSDCLSWHERLKDDSDILGPAKDVKGPLVVVDSTERKPEQLRLMMWTLSKFVFLESLGLVTDTGCVSLFGYALKDTPTPLLNDCLVLMELMRAGLLNGLPFSCPDGRQFPSVPESDPEVLFVSRVISLCPCPMRFKKVWLNHIDHDLSLFQGLVSTVKRTINHVSEASAACVVLNDFDRLAPLLDGPMFAETERFPHVTSHQNTLGVVCKYWLERDASEKGDRSAFSAALNQRFAHCNQPLEALMESMELWFEFNRIVGVLGEQVHLPKPFVELLDSSTDLIKQQVGFRWDAYLDKQVQSECYDQEVQGPQFLLEEFVIKTPTMPAFFVVNSENHSVLELDQDGLMNLLRKQTRAALSSWELGRVLSATEAESASLRVHDGCFLVVMPPVVGLVASDVVVLRASEQLDMGQVLQCIYRNFSILADSKRGLPACVGLGVKRSLPFVQEYRLPEGATVVRQHLAMAHLDVLLIALVQDIDLRIRKWEDAFTHHITQTEQFG